ncbi:hypothetical protein J1N35_023845 [Gossypium stocksii]|uniref:Uncharacterized protein n=1 Tax=Gossypium stocksii TaxID=47602 RepID=A0A9D4A4S4_9ROSI|nr:hypothetical protein J1N35_023845 [Gossypium stocksii]
MDRLSNWFSVNTLACKVRIAVWFRQGKSSSTAEVRVKAAEDRVKAVEWKLKADEKKARNDAKYWSDQAEKYKTGRDLAQETLARKEEELAKKGKELQVEQRAHTFTKFGVEEKIANASDLRIRKATYA